MEVSRLSVESGAIATGGRGRVCDTHHSSLQLQILNPLSEVRDRTRVLMDASWVRHLLSYDRNSIIIQILKSLLKRNSDVLRLLEYTFLKQLEYNFLMSTTF